MLYFRVSGRILLGVGRTLVLGIACKHNGRDCVNACFHGRIISICDHVVHLIRRRRFSLECLVQPLVLSSRGLDVSGVDVTERSSGAVGAQGLHKQRFPVMQGWARDGC